MVNLQAFHIEFCLIKRKMRCKGNVNCWDIARIFIRKIFLPFFCEIEWCSMPLIINRYVDVSVISSSCIKH